MVLDCPQIDKKLRYRGQKVTGVWSLVLALVNQSNAGQMRLRLMTAHNKIDRVSNEFQIRVLPIYLQG